ncbi:MAG: glycerophosphodiester phosphodiesterase [Calditrichia bacterium]
MFSLLSDIKKLGRPLILAHRGSQLIAHFPENTVPAFQEACQLGADGFELDIRQTKDGEIVVFHDQTLKRLLGKKGSIESLNCSNLQTFQFISSSNQEPIKIPSLAEVFNQFRDRVYYNIEVKKRASGYQTLCNKLVALIEKYGLDYRVWVSSFDPEFLIQWDTQRTGIPGALIFDVWNLGMLAKCKADYVHWLHPSIRLMKHFKNLRSLKKPLGVWTVNTVSEIQLLKSWEVAAIITDDVPTVRREYIRENN